MTDGIFFAMSFAEELMKIIYLNEGISWQPKESMNRILPMYIDRGRILPAFKVAAAIEVILERNYKDIVGCHADLIDNRTVTRFSFGYYAMKAVPNYFPYGYCPERMLIFFAMAAGVCRMCYRRDADNDVLESAAQVIGMVLTAYTLTGEFDLDAYDAFVKVSEKILHLCKKDK